jgi:type IV secretion system protein VirB9
VNRVCTLLVAGVMFLLGSTRPAGAEVVPSAGAIDPRVREAPYEAREVYRVQGEVGVALDLEFEPGERFLGLASGDRNALEFSSQGSHLFVKPKAAPVTTNITILTDRRVYRLAYVVAAKHEPETDSQAIYALRFTYPLTPLEATPKKAAETNGANAAPAWRDVRYQFCGPTALQPARVFDDGVRTTILFGPHQAWPAVFAVEPDGSESLVNFTATDQGLVIHRVADEFRLRRGRLVGCLRALPAGNSGKNVQ